MRAELWAELTRVVNPQEGDLLLRSIGFRERQLPSTELASRFYWSEVRRLVDAGVLEDGEGRLARALHEEYPGNRVFKACAEAAEPDVPGPRLVYPKEQEPALPDPEPEPEPEPEPDRQPEQAPDRYPTLVLVCAGHHAEFVEEVRLLDPGAEPYFASPGGEGQVGQIAVSLSRALSTRQISGLRERLAVLGAGNLDIYQGIYDHRPYLLAELRAEGPDRQPYELTDVPSITLVKDVAAAVLAHWERPQRPSDLVVERQEADGVHRKVHPDRSLHAAGVRDGDSLVVTCLVTSEPRPRRADAPTTATEPTATPPTAVKEPTATPPAVRTPAADWSLRAEAPTTARLGAETGITVFLDPHRPNAPARRPAATPGDTTLAVSLVLPRGMEALNGVDRELRVRSGSAEPVRFPVRALAPGRQVVVARVWSGGTYLGSLEMVVRVLERSGPTETMAYALPITRPYPEHGEAAIQIVEVPSSGGADAVTLQFQLRSSEICGHPVHLDLPAGHRDYFDRLRGKLCELAAIEGRSGHRAAMKRAEKHGMELWDQLIPRQIQREFQDIRATISSFGVAAADSAQYLPWELLFPRSPDRRRDGGFLVDEFPFTRQYLGGRRPPRQIFLDAPALVMAVPGGEHATAGAAGELTRLVGKIGSRGGDPLPFLDSAHDIKAWLEADADSGLLHLTAHDLADGNGISLRDGSFQPVDLAEVRRDRGPAGRNPLVFLNGFDSARLVQDLTRPRGWSTDFMGAGARNFIGAQWPVGAAAASAFAEAFYEEFAVRRRPIGPAVHHARLALRDASDDPARLAYTLHGDPWGCAAWQGDDGPLTARP